MAGFEPEVECLVIKATTNNKYLFRVGMALTSEMRGIGSRKESSQSGVLAGH